PEEAASATERLDRVVAVVSSSALSVLITGESGAGKKTVARSIHASSPRAARPLVLVSCASVTAGNFARELETAAGGRLLLDAVDELDPVLQAKLVRVLEDPAADVRVLSVAREDLPQLVADGDFRPDLYHCLNGITVVVPPLRERRERIAELA